MNEGWPAIVMLTLACVLVVGMLSDCTAKHDAAVRDHQYRMKQLELNCPDVDAKAKN